MSQEFLLTSMIVVLLPGAGVLYTVSSAIGGGRRVGLFAALGCTFGIVPHILAAMFGLSGVMQAGAAVFEVVRYAGIAYLVYLAVSVMRDGGALSFSDDRAVGQSMGGVVRRGIFLNLLNPKLTIFFFAFLPQFLDGPAGPLDPGLLQLAGAFMLMTLVVFAAYAWLSAAIREAILGVPAVRRWVQRMLGVLLLGFAARLAVADR
jgi:threonine/homoserine/homoserine lactone efflux protein